ncbi:glutaredoxin family protein [Psychromonas sp. RZ22]|uniref:glutaredoxin family protein n=1 Tax=Psychromonas algarum TaxID=2555643 RepID=UPI001067A55F|nr:glutaredoxin family protein [Psychromonas sp. RZ22]TEW56188.1 glutaredoxin family protein [Psychromonas sp. RZ22]
MSLPILYHTDGCHLCEQAMALLAQCQVNYQLIDIISEQSLVDLFGIRIPVLKNTKGQYLDWPFEHFQIKQFLSC